MSLFSHLELVEDKRSSINQHHDLTNVFSYHLGFSIRL
ncbi:hypothetical protein PPIS_a1201 [Pseudoalteromonas piscicida]|uniref:Uncharacterized protein n=1 Tax=Pseudoalteromonas piscicida TaxID=43662 RepID=A0ABN5CBW8_PSEO7|nr:hypothetical protein PPIS_a1201 [Pseudoalteromonas piscicida]